MRCSFSYRDLEEMMAERSLVDQVTIWRWVQLRCAVSCCRPAEIRWLPSSFCNWRCKRTGRRPRVINMDGHPAYATAVSELKQSRDLGRRCRCRQLEPRYDMLTTELPRLLHGSAHLQHTGKRSLCDKRKEFSRTTVASMTDSFNTGRVSSSTASPTPTATVSGPPLKTVAVFRASYSTTNR